MPKIIIKPQRVSEAKRFYQILNNPNFIFLRIRMNGFRDEIAFMKKNAEKRRNNFEHNYTIFCDGKIVGAIGMKINQHRPFTGEIGYFVDEEYWGKGIASLAVKQLEKIGFTKLKLKRIEIVMDIRHPASEKVAIKCGYKKEGIMKKAIETDGKYCDAYLYAKTK
ncbi:MAG: GNAT family N-acetyltransferase [Candidatus Paceibacterota bacterium]|jgi:ribosomal-protein-alanine N-acetyltransferase